MPARVSEDHPRLDFGQVQEIGILRPGAVGSGPKHIVASVAEPIDNRLRKILIGDEAHEGRIYAGIGYALYSCAR